MSKSSWKGNPYFQFTRFNKEDVIKNEIAANPYRKKKR
jgi:hypothetical protein